MTDATDIDDTDSEEAQGGRIFFSNAGRSLEGEDEIVLVSVGVDIGSSTSHLVFSRLVLERLDNRYVVTTREVLHESDVLLTPYAEDTTIDAAALRVFVDAQYAAAKVEPETIDTGALILTGVAVRRANARAIGEVFAAQAGKFVSVSAGDGLETTLAAFGSGAVARSIRDRSRVMNIDIGGGTSKIAVRARGRYCRDHGHRHRCARHCARCRPPRRPVSRNRVNGLRAKSAWTSNWARRSANPTPRRSSTAWPIACSRRSRARL